MFGGFSLFISELSKIITSGAAAAGRIPGRAAAAAPAARGMRRLPVSTRTDHPDPTHGPSTAAGTLPRGLSPQAARHLSLAAEGLTAPRPQCM